MSLLLEKLHPECKRILQHFVTNPPLPIGKASLDEVRKGHTERNIIFQGGLEQPFKGQRKLITIPSPQSDVSEGISALHYIPDALSQNPTILVYFHGGGMTLGTKEGYDSTCKFIAENTPCIVINSDYRLAPENKYPTMFDDACAVTSWVMDNKAALGGTRESKVGIAGDSAGGTLSASVAHDIPGLAFQVLIYPHVTPSRDYSLPSFTTYHEGPLLTVNLIRWFEGNYVPEGEERNPRIASILRPSFNHLPQALVLIAECDPLSDGSRAYAEKLQQNGVKVEVHEFPGAIHAFFHATAMCPTLTREANMKIVNFLKSLL